eukprot:gene8389-18305_t
MTSDIHRTNSNIASCTYKNVKPGRNIHGISSSASSSSVDVKRTLDARHTKHLGHMRMKQSQLASMRSDQDCIQSELNKLTENTPRSAWADHDFERFATLSDRLHTTRQQVKYLQNSGDENDYFLRTGDILYKYYEIIDSNKNDSKKDGNDVLESQFPKKSDTSTVVSSPSSSLNSYSSSTSGILTYFLGKVGSSSSPTSMISTSASVASLTSISTATSLSYSHNISPVSSSPSISSHEGASTKFPPNDTDRATLLDRYIAIAYDDGPMRTPTVQQDDSKRAFGTSGVDRVCPHCESTQHMLNMQDGCIVCMQCRSVEYILIDHDKPTYKDPPKDAACFAYKRINHLNEWLNQVQGKETTEIPEDVFMNIIMEIKKQKITNMATLTPKRIRAILKKIDSNKYYEHIPHIMHRLNGIPTIHMPPDLEDKVRCMFCAIQIPFLKYQPPKRKNFLSYSYCLHKMMQLLEKDQYLVNFPLLKSREKLYQQDQIWKKICEDVRWDFIPSL